METNINNSQNKNEPYELPSGWKWVRLGEVCEIIMGQSPPGFTYIDSPNGLPFFQGKADFGKYFPKERVWCTYPMKVAQKGDVLISVRAPVGPVNMNSFQCCIGRGLAAIRPKGKVMNWFIFWYLRAIESQIASLASGSTFAAITRNDLTCLNIPFPPLPEQRRIAAKLQELMQDIESARNACEKQLEAARALPSAYLREVFESPEAKRWEIKRLGEVCKIFSGSPAPQNKRYFQNGEHPFVRVHDLAKYKRTTELVETNDCINDDAIKELQLVKAKKGTILFPKSGAAIRTNNRAILGLDAFIVSHLAAISPRPEFADTYFVYYWLCLADMVHLMENPGYPSLKLSTVSKTSIPLPPVSTQRRVASELKEKMNYIDRLESLIQDQQSALGVLYETILKKAFRGEL